MVMMNSRAVAELPLWQSGLLLTGGAVIGAMIVEWTARKLIRTRCGWSTTPSCPRCSQSWERHTLFSSPSSPCWRSRATTRRKPSPVTKVAGGGCVRADVRVERTWAGGHAAGHRRLYTARGRGRVAGTGTWAICPRAGVGPAAPDAERSARPPGRHRPVRHPAREGHGARRSPAGALGRSPRVHTGHRVVRADRRRRDQRVVRLGLGAPKLACNSSRRHCSRCPVRWCCWWS